LSLIDKLQNGRRSQNDIEASLFGNLRHGFGWHGAVARAALFVKEVQNLAESVGIGGVPKIGTLTPNGDEADLLQFLKMVRQRGSGYSQFVLDFAGDHPGGMGREKRTQDLKPGFGAQGGEAVGGACNQQGVWFLHNSIIAERQKYVKPLSLSTFGGLFAS
jgi:hypothetical protein